jgi:hypothetical protein
VEARRIIDESWELGEAIVEFVQTWDQKKRGSMGFIDARVVTTAVVFALGRMAGRYGFRSMKREEFWKLFTAEELRPLFYRGFAEERKEES